MPKLRLLADHLKIIPDFHLEFISCCYRETFHYSWMILDDLLWQKNNFVNFWLNSDFAIPTDAEKKSSKIPPFYRCHFETSLAVSVTKKITNILVLSASWDYWQQAIIKWRQHKEAFWIRAWKEFKNLDRKVTQPWKVKRCGLDGSPF